MDKTIQEEFQTSLKNGMFTGSLKFSNLYVSPIQLYSAVKEWEKEDKGLIYASIRPDGTDFVTLDFRYDRKNLKKSAQGGFLYDFLKPLFEKKLGGDYIQAWSLCGESIVIK
ncbi:hypothetical protein KBG23_00545 [Candidatus Dojkabacteria bacterium]|jgi:hypothetical protein|nr:hypothetical protein [Candidatus Dojkabacteria bacterium]